MTRTPLVTLGLPVRNGAPVLREALAAALAQTVDDFELIIADNASTDDTERICREWAQSDERIRYFRHSRNLGAAANFNFTFHQARGKYFKWVAHDDVIAPTYLERCLEQFRQGPASLVLCFGRRRFLTCDGQLLPREHPSSRQYEARRSYDRLRFGQIIRLPGTCFPTMIFGLARTEALSRTRLLGAFPTADVVLIAELRLLGEFAEVPEDLYYQRHHGPDPEWQRRRSKRGEAQWYDPINCRTCIAPALRCFNEHLRGIYHVPATRAAKLNASLAMVGYWPARIRRLTRTGTFVQRVKEELVPHADPGVY